MNFGFAFAPLVPPYVLWAAAAVALVVAGLLLLARSRGAWMRIGALALLVLALANPSFTREDRDPLPSVAAVVIDKSPSQSFGDRASQTEVARQKRTSSLERLTVTRKTRNTFVGELRDGRLHGTGYADSTPMSGVV